MNRCCLWSVCKGTCRFSNSPREVLLVCTMLDVVDEGERSKMIFFAPNIRFYKFVERGLGVGIDGGCLAVYESTGTWVDLNLFDNIGDNKSRKQGGNNGQVHDEGDKVKKGSANMILKAVHYP